MAKVFQGARQFSPTNFLQYTHKKPSHPQLPKAVAEAFQNSEFLRVCECRTARRYRPGSFLPRPVFYFLTGNVKVRMVEYTPGYVADHWCSRGHVLLVMEGELVTELKDDRKFKMDSGMSYQVASDAEPHRSSTVGGAKLFVVD